MFPDSTFPWVLTKIVFYNSAWWLSAGVLSFLPASVSSICEFLGGIHAPLDGNADALHKLISPEALPAGEPYNGGLTEEPDAALHPGLGDFFEPEMHPAEKQPHQE